MYLNKIKYIFLLIVMFYDILFHESNVVDISK